jgi:hypothetical protein
MSTSEWIMVPPRRRRRLLWNRVARHPMRAIGHGPRPPLALMESDEVRRPGPYHPASFALVTKSGVSLSSISAVSFITSVASLPNPLFSRAMFRPAFSSRPFEGLCAKGLACRHHGPGDARQLVGHCGAGQPRGPARHKRHAVAQRPSCSRRRAARRPSAIACRDCSARNQQSPDVAIALAMAPNLSLPPLEFWPGADPGQAEKPRPGLKTFGSGTLAAIAEAASFPIPGMPASNWLIGFCA